MPKPKKNAWACPHTDRAHQAHGLCNACNTAAWLEKHRTAYNTGVRARYAEDPSLKRANTLKHMYGVSQSQYDSMVEVQAGLCAICCEPMNPRKGTHVDHDHACCPGRRSCGKCVRGLLCGRCNTGIGQLRSPEIMFSAAEYVQTHV